MADLTIIADCLGRAEPRGLMRVLVGRSLATNRRNRIAILLVHVGRSLATSCWCFLGAPDLRPVSSVCGRRNEAIALRRCLRIAAVEWSGLQSWRVRPGRGRNSADTCHERFRGSVGSVKPGLLFCAAIAALPISSAKRPSFLFMPDPRALKPLKNLDGWIAPKTSDEDGSSNVRARVAQAPPGMT